MKLTKNLNKKRELNGKVPQASLKTGVNIITLKYHGKNYISVHYYFHSQLFFRPVVSVSGVNVSRVDNTQNSPFPRDSRDTGYGPKLVSLIVVWQKYVSKKYIGEKYL